MLLTLVAGARPNFMKIAPLIHALQTAQQAGSTLRYRLVHTGQHYDERMSQSFFRDLGIPAPDVNLEVGSGSHATQTAQVLIAFERELLSHRPDWVVVVGDVNSTLACTLAAKKLGVRVAHVEAGLRSFDWSMPEEVNRVATDALCDLFFTTTPEAGYQLMRQGAEAQQIQLVGNVMIDTLVRQLPSLQAPPEWTEWQLSAGQYGLITLHRPSNVDDAEQLQALLELLAQESQQRTLVFPVHPRTHKQLQPEKLPPSIRLTDPLPYPQFMYLVQHAWAVLTDSGGIQEETTYLGVPCITLRDNTERPETVRIGSNVLAGTQHQGIRQALRQLCAGAHPKGRIPLYWDGQTATRIVAYFQQLAASL